MHVWHIDVKEEQLKDKEEKKSTKEKEGYSATLARKSFMINLWCYH